MAITLIQILYIMTSSHLLLQEASLIHKALYNEGVANLSRINEIKSLSVALSDAFESMSGILNKESKQFFSKLKTDHNQNQGIIFLNQFVGDMVKQIATSMSVVSKQIKSNILDPLVHFISNMEDTNKRLCRDSISYINEIEENSNNLKAIQKSYKDTIARAKKKNGSRSADEVMDQQAIYRQQITITNLIWAQIQSKYKKLIKDFDFGNESRCVFTKNLQIKLVRILNEIVNSSNTQEYVKQFEQYPYQNNQLENVILQNIQKEFGRSQLLRERVVQKFNMPMMVEEGEVQEQERITKKKVEQFSEVFLNKSSIKDQKQYQGIRTVIIQSPRWTEVFLNSLACKLYTEVSLPLEKYHELLTIVKYIFAELAEQVDNYFIIYNLLYISLRINTGGIYLIKQFSKYPDYWQKEQRWNKMFLHLKKQFTQRTKKNTYFEDIKKRYTKGIFNQGLKKLGILQRFTVDEKQYKDEQQRLTYEAMHEINMLISKLELKSQFSIKTIISLCKKYRLNRGHIQKLVKYQEYTKKHDLDKQYFNSKLVRNRKEQKMKQYSSNKLLVIVKMSLKYINIEDNLFRFLLVSKKWNQFLRVPILKRYLRGEKDFGKISKIRMDLYQQIVPKGFTAEIYRKMLKEVPHQTQFRELIELDVKRSCNKRQELQPLLLQILMVFSYYQNQIGYLQGMNYMAEHLLKLGQPQHITYNIFAYILNTHFATLFTPNFDNLKLRIYQFTRLMQKYLPALHSHFINEKVEGQHFLIPWAITLWGEYEGDLVWILWDGFMIDGWKWWIKVGLWILKMLEPEFLNMGFEQILKFFSEMSTKQLFAAKFSELVSMGMCTASVKQQINSIRVTDSMLKDIEKQYIYTVKKYIDVLDL